MTPLAFTDDEIDTLLGLTLTERQRVNLRRVDEYPPNIFIGNRKRVLATDLEVWLERQRDRAAAKVVRRTARAKIASAARWSRRVVA